MILNFVVDITLNELTSTSDVILFIKACRYIKIGQGSVDQQGHLLAKLAAWEGLLESVQSENDVAHALHDMVPAYYAPL